MFTRPRNEPFVAKNPTAGPVEQEISTTVVKNGWVMRVGAKYDVLENGGVVCATVPVTKIWPASEG
jgi:hypothetical protein